MSLVTNQRCRAPVLESAGARFRRYAAHSARKDHSLEHPSPNRNIVLTPEQVAFAPDEVRQWLSTQCGHSAGFEHEFILERNGAATSGDGLAICTALEIKNLLHMLSDDFLSCQILFELGCEYYNPTTAEHRGHVIRLNDFLHHTDARDILEVHQCLDTINAALQRLRHDPDTTIYRPDECAGFHVHEQTQHMIYQLWRRLLGGASSSRRKKLAAEVQSRPVEAA